MKIEEVVVSVNESCSGTQNVAKWLKPLLQSRLREATTVSRAVETLSNVKSELLTQGILKHFDGSVSFAKREGRWVPRWRLYDRRILSVAVSPTLVKNRCSISASMKKTLIPSVNVGYNSVFGNSYPILCKMTSSFSGLTWPSISFTAARPNLSSMDKDLEGEVVTFDRKSLLGDSKHATTHSLRLNYSGTTVETGLKSVQSELGAAPAEKAFTAFTSILTAFSRSYKYGSHRGTVYLCADGMSEGTASLTYGTTARQEFGRFFGELSGLFTGILTSNKDNVIVNGSTNSIDRIPIRGHSKASEYRDYCHRNVGAWLSGQLNMGLTSIGSIVKSGNTNTQALLDRTRIQAFADMMYDLQGVNKSFLSSFGLGILFARGDNLSLETGYAYCMSNSSWDGLYFTVNSDKSSS